MDSAKNVSSHIPVKPLTWHDRVTNIRNDFQNTPPQPQPEKGGCGCGGK